MAFSSLQRLSARVFARLRHLLERSGDWIDARPRLAAWVYPNAGDNSQQRYRRFNERYFADLFQQERMLADQRRMAFYHAAVTRRVKPGDRVIDLGTGTGILAAFAARSGAAKVYAIDHSAILEHARNILASNRVPNVEFVAMHSSRFTADERVDVIVHEQMGDFLFDEEMVTNVSDLRDRLLKPGGRIVPSLFELFIEPIEIQDGRRVPFIWELEVYGIDYRCMERERPQNPDYYRLSSCDLGVVHHFLAETEPALRIDLQTIDEASLPREVHLRRRVTQGGRLDGFAVYFRARVDEDLSLSSDPLDPARAPHWGYRILRMEEQRYEVGDQIDFHLNVERWAEVDTWRWGAERMKAEGGRAEG